MIIMVIFLRYYHIKINTLKIKYNYHIKVLLNLVNPYCKHML
jgi:hypothetical protein